MIISSLFLTVHTHSQEDVDKILGNIQRKFEKTDTVFYEFKQVKSITQLSEPLHFTGTMVFRKPHFIKLELRGEENIVLYVNGEKIWIEDLDLQEVEAFDFDKLGLDRRISRLLPPIMLQSIQELEEKFEVRLTNKKGEREILEFKPRDKTEFSFKRFQISVDGLSRLTWMKVNYTSGDYTETWFSGWKKLPAISKHFFTYRKK
jgi:outer membrane lipoprotein-sorting protein